MIKLRVLLGSAVMLSALTAPTHASIMFTFAESGGNLTMLSSGVLNTANLVSGVLNGWGSAGNENNDAPESDIMGDTTMGALDTTFGFSAGTDLSAWVGNMFTSGFFGYSSSGTTQFATYEFPGDVRTPGIGIASEDLVGALWTPDVSWTAVGGTLAGAGLTPGTYTVSDARTAESITIQIGDAGPGPSPVPTPATLALLGLGLAGLGWSRRKKT